MVDSSEHITGVGPLLETKLFIPTPRTGLVARPKLVERLDQITDVKLILISAPAGFGKTTLLAEWLATPRNQGQSVAWISLDPTDNDQILFQSYFISALVKALPGMSDGTLSLLRSPQPLPIEMVMTTLINEISRLDSNIVLVLDDFHVIDSSPIIEAMDFLLEHLPAQLHIVIASRADPPLSLTRLRGRGECMEIRAADLRFTADEAAAFLNGLMGLELSATDVAALEQRTEGWIAGLQLAGLSMQARDDVAGFIANFAGDNRYIVDYLVEEVLQNQPDEVRDFLLGTSVLNRLCAPLCDAVTGRVDSKQVLESLERDNLFVVPQDDKRYWYRYHHLFADVLQAHLVDESPGQISASHQRASEWYEQNDQLADAIRHAIAAEDFSRAARLVELAWRPMDRSRRLPAWHGWTKSLPAEQISSRPVLSLACAWALLESGELEVGNRQLNDTERLLDLAVELDGCPGASAMVIDDEEEFRFLPASIAAARAYHAQAQGNREDTIAYARRALDLLPEHEDVRRSSPAALLALSAWGTGDLETAERSLASAIAGARNSGNVRFVITGTFVLTEVRIALGRLHRALDAYRQALDLAATSGPDVLRGAADLYTGLAKLHIEWNDLEAAEQHLSRSKELGQHAGLLHWRYRWCVTQASLERARGNLPRALDLLDEAERHYVRGPVPEAYPVAALQARIQVALGNLEDATAWAHDRGIAPDDQLSYLSEFEQMTLARILIARYLEDPQNRLIQDALSLLERLLLAAEADDRTRSTIQILILQALARQNQGSVEEAQPPFDRALSLAEPEGYVRTFLDEGPAVRQLLGRAVQFGIAGSYARDLLSAFEESSGSVSPDAQPVVAAEALVEPLTPRELEILRLISAGLKNREIADQLFISLSTVKRHIANIYGKLGVGHRTQALARASELQLL